MPPAVSRTWMSTEVSGRNTWVHRRGQSSGEAPSFYQCLWSCAHTSPIFRLMKSLLFTLSAWNTPEMKKQDTSTVNKPHSYSHMSSPSHYDGWPCQGEGRPGAKADHSGLLSGCSCSDKMQFLQEEKSCWLKGFVQVSLQDETLKWSQAICISFYLLFIFSLNRSILLLL